MISKVKAMLEQMTYRDMVDFSTMLSERLTDMNASPEGIAEALLSLPVDTSDDQIAKTNHLLAECFGRKRQITVQPMNGGGFKITCPSFEGAVVFDNNIREGISQLLDTLTVLKGME